MTDRPTLVGATGGGPTGEALIAAARAARRLAYAPYSRFQVGAALGFADGRIVTAANVENASYGLSLCAETNAVAQAMAAGVRGGLQAVAVVGATTAMGADDDISAGGAAPLLSPCGRCRQILWELARSGGTDPLIYHDDGSGPAGIALSLLLPLAFGPDNLDLTK